MAKTKYKLTAIIAILSMLCSFVPVTSGSAAQKYADAKELRQILCQRIR